VDEDSSYYSDVSEVVKKEIERGDDSLASSIGLSLTYDRRNHPRNPTGGYYLQLATDMAGLGGGVQYVRVNGEGRFDDPTSEKMRDVIDLVIQALTRAQKRGREAQVIPFPTHTAAS